MLADVNSKQGRVTGSDKMQGVIIQGIVTAPCNIFHAPT